MKRLFDNLIKSFTTDSEGFSARKLSAFVAVITSIYITAKELPQDAQLHALYAWLGFGLLCLGIVTIDKLIQLKNGSNSQQEIRTP